MTLPGRVENGVVILDGKSILPEGAVVTVSYEEPTAPKPAGAGRRIQLPLVPSDQPGSLDLTGEMIAEILDEEDAAPRR
jgi:hypothetical protein